MALSRTLIRTYALQYHARPDYVLRVANRRILMDSDAKQFVTVFYGVLDPLAGTLTYCNAGHNPPYLLSAQSRDPVQELGGTGIPLGIFEGETWGQASVQIRPGDVLFVYSDGITDAEDDRGEFFGEKRLLDVARSCAGHSAQEAQETVLGAVHQFVGDAPQFDDITLMIVARNPET
jgi:sigma-B regulation protein RsbU (phosphoserine phosphatase)